MSPTEVIGIEVPQYVGEGEHTTLVPRVVGRTEEAKIQKGSTQGTAVDVDWEYYAHALPEERHAVARELFDRIAAAISHRDLQWMPVLRRQYYAFQRPGGYNVIGANVFREKPIHFWIKLPLPIDGLQSTRQGVENPYPELSSRWDPANKQMGWSVPTMGDVPDVGTAIDLTRQYQPEDGPMVTPAALGPSET
jgi:hypothetical protein